jgi:hypothetical protein
VLQARFGGLDSLIRGSGTTKKRKKGVTDVDEEEHGDDDEQEEGLKKRKKADKVNVDGDNDDEDEDSDEQDINLKGMGQGYEIGDGDDDANNSDFDDDEDLFAAALNGKGEFSDESDLDPEDDVEGVLSELFSSQIQKKDVKKEGSSKESVVAKKTKKIAATATVQPSQAAQVVVFQEPGKRDPTGSKHDWAAFMVRSWSLQVSE